MTRIGNGFIPNVHRLDLACDRLPDVNISDMKLLATVAETRNISAAARALGMSPSLATRKLAAMESELGMRLLHRTTRRVELSEAGRLMADTAREILGRYEGAVDALQQLNSEPAGLVRIVCPEMLAVRFLPKILGDFARCYPLISTSVITSDDPTSFSEDAFDIAVHIGSAPRSDFIARHVLDIELLVCATPAYLAELGTPEVPEELDQHRCLTHSTFDGGVWWFKEGDRPESSKSIAPFVQTTNTLFLHQAALQSLGIARLTRRTVHQDLIDGSLVRVLPEYDCVFEGGQKRAIWVVFPHRQTLHRTRLFIDALVASLEQADLD